MLVQYWEIYRSTSTIFLRNPQAEQKERSHEALGKCKKKAEGRELITLCHESEEVYISDSNTM